MSKLMCWLARDRAASVAEIRGDPQAASVWRATAGGFTLTFTNAASTTEGSWEFDSATGRHLRNFPQAFSHLALLDAAARIILFERLSEL